MTNDRNRHLDDLPGDLESSLVVIDKQLAADAAQQAVPEGLIDRVYDASVELLPDDQLAPIPITLRFSKSSWGRLAMAASLAVAFVLGARVLRTSPPQPVVVPTYVSNTQLSREAELVVIDTLGVQSTRMQDLVTMRDATYDELTAEIAVLVAELEM
jgi:hypothetical protein